MKLDLRVVAGALDACVTGRRSPLLLLAFGVGDLPLLEALPPLHPPTAPPALHPLLFLFLFSVVCYPVLSPSHLCYPALHSHLCYLILLCCHPFITFVPLRAQSLHTEDYRREEEEGGGLTSLTVLGRADRGSDELLSQTGAVSNGSVMSPAPNHADNNNDAKKLIPTSSSIFFIFLIKGFALWSSPFEGNLHKPHFSRSVEAAMRSVRIT
ncbi:hypothetical protein E2C01_047932 [Portunus trituberculatus]|uniref:Uncharacterized protein n=1 Tax=Portunus trituberculatus TaxID=210409 RepID=A0A5B7G975_PORTR|nr:hypothetical protein [Portunus trituberculatus]